MQLGVEASARIDLRENTQLQSVIGQMTLGLGQYENRNKDDPVRLEKHRGGGPGVFWVYQDQYIQSGV